MRRLVSIADFREEARRRLPRLVFDYLDGGAEDEVTLRRNREVFERLRLCPRPLNDVSRRDQSTQLFGSRIAMPVVIAPTGLNGLFWRDGDIALARAAAQVGIPFVLSTASNSTIEEVAERAGGDLWFQLYIVSRSIADGLVARALSVGYRTLVLTVDVSLSGKRERDLRNRFSQPFKPSLPVLADMLRHPRWLASTLRSGAPELKNLASAAAADANAQAALLSRQMDASFSWDDLGRLRDRWPHRLLVKGLLHPDDARRAVAAGVDGVILSNHGGRQLDGVTSPIEVLPRFTERLPVPLLVDSGFRRGSDIVKALASGADAVLLGRATLYGLAVAGEAGVTAVLALLRDEIDRVLALLGCQSLAALGPHSLDGSGREIA
ncbi:MAG TPA: alpha-hydroxy-acid oxidizing protein [Stellaceae bacterium]|nr:alpha-hydroxy-acid oxidizing protein [Stellaceae bacterium]